MKRITKAILFILAMVFSISAVACARDDDGVEIDPTKTQLWVSIYDGGYGTEWADSLAARFEEHYKEESFEDGKTGVQVIVTPNKSSGTGLMSTILSSRNEVFFSPEAYYYDYMSEGVFADITDIVSGTNSSLAEYGDTGTIEDKFLSEHQKSYYKTSDNKYYALPGEIMFSGFTYDVDLFEKEGYYFSANPNNGNKGFIITKTEQRSKGPDGKTGIIDGVDYSLDDGLPATYEEFFKLCNYIYEGGNVPLIWSGQYRMGYIGWLLQALMADYEGAEQMLLLILPDDVLITPELKVKLEKYLANGGKIIASGISGVNEEKTDFALSEWKELFEFKGVDKSNASYFRFTENYVKTPDMDFSMYEHGIVFNAKEKAKNYADYVKAYFNKGWDGRHSLYYAPPEKKTGNSAFAGSDNIIHICFNIFESYYKNAMREHKELIKFCLDRFYTDPLIKDCTLPSTARATVTVAPHVTNLHVKVTFPEMRGEKQIIEEHQTVPAGHSLKVRGAFTNVYSAPDRVKIESVIEDGYTKITLPFIEGYKLIALEK